MQNYSGLDSCFISNKTIATLLSHHEIKFSSYLPGSNTSKSIRINKFFIKKIFNTNKADEVIIVTENTIAKLNTTTKEIVGGEENFEEDPDIRSIVYSEDGNVAIVGKFMIMVTN